MWPPPVVPNGGRQPKGGSMSLTGQTPDGKKRQVDLLFAVKSWPTPISRDHKIIHASEETHAKNARPLSECVGRQDRASRKANGKSRASLRLNPDWVCTLMGFPSDWLHDVEWPPSKRSATRSSRSVRKS